MNTLLQKATRQHTKDHNSRLLLRTIYDSGMISRAELARRTNLTRTTVSEVVGGLIEQGLVEEMGAQAGSVGRAPTMLSVVDDARHVVAVNITNGAMECALVNLRGTVQQRVSVPIIDHDGSTVLAQLCRAIDDVIAAAVQPLLGIGISTPGLLDAERGTVRRAVIFDWRNLHLRDIMQARYNVPVYIANDSHMLALAEYLFIQHQHTSNLVVLKVGQGISAGVVLHGQLLHGDALGAGEIGHVVVDPDGPPCTCGNTGCLEAVANIPALVRHAQAAAAEDPRSLLHRFASNAETRSFDTLVQAFLAGDAAAQRVVRREAHMLSIAVANLVAILGIRRVIITGQIAPLGRGLRDMVVEGVGRRLLPDLAQAVEIDVFPPQRDGVLLGATALLLTNELGLARLLPRLPREEGVRA